MSALQAQFRDLAEWATDSSPLYAHLCREAAEDSDILDIAATVPEGRQAPHLLLAAVHYLLDRHPDHRLAEYYPSISPESQAPDDGCFPAFREFCLDHADAIRPLLRTRRTQTNAVRRSAVLDPAIARCQLRRRAARGGERGRALGPCWVAAPLRPRRRVVGNSDSQSPSGVASDVATRRSRKRRPLSAPGSVSTAIRST